MGARKASPWPLGCLDLDVNAAEFTKSQPSKGRRPVMVTQPSHCPQGGPPTLSGMEQEVRVPPWSSSIYKKVAKASPLRERKFCISASLGFK